MLDQVTLIQGRNARAIIGVDVAALVIYICPVCLLHTAYLTSYHSPSIYSVAPFPNAWVAAEVCISGYDE